MAGDVVLEARGLVKDYRRDRAVDGVSITVHTGERVALLGPNGAGKTTTLLMVLGVVSPDEGDVAICGFDLARAIGAGRPNKSALPPGISRSPSGCACANTSRCTGSSTACGSHAPHQGRPRPLSDRAPRRCDGHRTVVRAAHLDRHRATLHEPKLLVLDEPTASLDPDVAQRVRNGLLELCERDGTALLMTSHDMSDVEQVCERVVFLSHGRIVADGPPESVAAAFGGDLEGVFLHLAERHEPSGAQQSDHP